MYYTAENDEMFITPARFINLGYRIISRLELNRNGLVKAWLVSTNYPRIMKDKSFRKDDYIWVRPEDIMDSEI